jgi:hypothetical protein
MKQRFKHIYQFKITLKKTKPPIWRRIQVPETYNFWELHAAIIDAMGWSGYSIHEFRIMDPKAGFYVNIGIPSEDSMVEILPGWEQKIANYFSMANPKATYVYNFNDYWEHKIELEKILPREKGVEYPICLKGKRACPPEDCRGADGYKELVQAMKNPDPNYERYKEVMDLLEAGFDPEYFDVTEIEFQDPDDYKDILDYYDF